MFEGCAIEECIFNNEGCILEDDIFQWAVEKAEELGIPSEPCPFATPAWASPKVKKLEEFIKQKVKERIVEKAIKAIQFYCEKFSERPLECYKCYNASELYNTLEEFVGWKKLQEIGMMIYQEDLEFLEMINANEYNELQIMYRSKLRELLRKYES